MKELMATSGGAGGILVILSLLFGTGGVGYALIQWVLKRNDPETQANAARVLTSAASDIIAELHSEKKDFQLEMKAIKQEVKNFHKTVYLFVQAVEEVIPLLKSQGVETIKLQTTMHDVRTQL